MNILKTVLFQHESVSGSVRNRREEWRKHGACAACVEGMNSPLRYFQICLKLREQFDIQTLVPPPHTHTPHTRSHQNLCIFFMFNCVIFTTQEKYRIVIQ